MNVSAASLGPCQNKTLDRAGDAGMAVAEMARPGLHQNPEPIGEIADRRRHGD